MGAKWNRRIRKTDATQKEISEGLRRAAVEVWEIGEPCDLLCFFWCKKHGKHCWQTLEVKSLADTKIPKARIRSDQPEQNQFLDRTRTPVITNSMEALLALSIHE